VTSPVNAASTPVLVIVTPAKNEERDIGRLIEAMVSQTFKPARWVIVNDGSSDRTGEIAKGFASRHAWIEVVDLPAGDARGFAAKARTFAAGYLKLRDVPHDVVANVDADVSFDVAYLEFLMSRFIADPSLGVAGTVFVEDGYDSAVDSFEGEAHVPGGCQFFRRACFEEIGGYVQTKIGMDWIAVTTARMLGWKTQSFREKAFQHHRPLGTAGRGALAAARLYGEKDYRLGWHPLYELVRILYRTSRDPLVGASIAVGYCRAFLSRAERPVSPALMSFHRAEQTRKLSVLVQQLLARKPVDTFKLSNNDAKWRSRGVD